MQLNPEKVKEAIAGGYWYWCVVDHRAEGGPDSPPDFIPEGKWVYMPPFDDMLRRNYSVDIWGRVPDRARRQFDDKGFRIPVIKSED